jgi:hypothetical protein
MKIENLIDNLSQNLLPVKRIHPPLLTFLSWLSFSLLNLLFFIWWRSGNFQRIHFPVFYYELIPVFLLILSSAYIAICRSIPGERLGKRISRFPALLFLLWIGPLLIRLIFFRYRPDSFVYEYHECIKDLFIMNLPATFFFIYLLRERSSNSVNKISFWIFSASAFGSYLGEAFLCPNESSSHLLLVHTLPVFMYSLFGILMGGYLLNTKTSVFVKK